MQTPDIFKLKAGDQPTWDIAFHYLWPIACRAALRHLEKSYPGDVKDIASVSIREAAEGIDQTSSFAELQMLTAVIAHRKALDHLRRMGAKRRGGGKIESIEGHDPPAPDDPLAPIVAVELASLLSQLMRILPRQDRELFQAYHIDRMKQEELAKQFKMPIGTVGVKLSKSLRLLKVELARNPVLMKELRELLR